MMEIAGIGAVMAAVTPSAMVGGIDFAPIIAGLLALAYLAQGGRRRLRM